MEISIRENEDFIRLGQALKKSGIAGSGTDAKMMITDGLVLVNGTTELRRGRKLYPNDTVSVGNEVFQITK